MSDAIVKNLNFGIEARDNVFKGIEKLTQAVSSTLGASGKCVILEDNTGRPVITKDGVTVARHFSIEDEIENEDESEGDKSSDTASESENKTDKESAKEESSEKQE